MKDRERSEWRKNIWKKKLSKCQGEQKSKEEEVKTLQKEIHNLIQQEMDSMKEVDTLKEEVVHFKGEINKLKYHLNISEKFKEST